MDVKPGTRMRCETCSSEFIVVTPADQELSCCGAPLGELKPQAK